MNVQSVHFHRISFHVVLLFVRSECRFVDQRLFKLEEDIRLEACIEGVFRGVFRDVFRVYI